MGSFIPDTLSTAPPPSLRKSNSLTHQLRRVLILLSVLAAFYVLHQSSSLSFKDQLPSTAIHHYETVARCRHLNDKPGPPDDFYKRKESDRFVPGTKTVFIRNATIWTGFDDGKEVFTGDILLGRGLIRWIGHDLSARVEASGLNADVIDAEGAWLTPGIVDIHSHIGVEQAPDLQGSEDGNSMKGTSGSGMPWLRSLDGLNTHDDSIGLAIAGGLTTSLILPGSANAIGGQGFAMKMRPTAERTPTSFLLEPPFGLNGSDIDYTLNSPPRWRHMKHACGENPSRVYSQSRMDTAWDFRKVYDKARQIKQAQDTFCHKVLSGQMTEEAEFPEELQWEAVVDVLRGKVKVQTHCYEAVDLDNFVRLSNEFKFPVAAFHHAHETYLVPDLLKQAYGAVPPASAMFASFSRYKREAYRHSEFAPRILHDAGLKVIMKSDHAAIVSRHLLHEAQQAHYYGLPPNIALRSVISTPADVMGYGHRIGYIREGYDADIVLWDSNPLQLGATPTQVFIDGIAQLTSPAVQKKPTLQDTPKTPNFDKETEDTIKYEGLPPLGPQESIDEIVIFTNVSTIWTRGDNGLEQSLLAQEGANGVAVVEVGKVICAGVESSCASYIKTSSTKQVDLRGGSITPGLISIGTYLGLQEISMESSTVDGVVFDPLKDKIPTVLGGDTSVIRAVDGLMFSTRSMLLSYRAGITSAITAPTSTGFLSGLSAQISTGASHRSEPGAVIQDVVALHIAIGHYGGSSISTQISALRNLLLGKIGGDLGHWAEKVVKGKIPLVVETHSADQIATLILLKQEAETISGRRIRLTIVGGGEAHILAQELGEAGVGVILNPVRPFPADWDRRRSLPGPPLTEDSAVMRLIKHNVTVGFGVAGGNLPPMILQWAARNTRFDISWAYIEAGGTIGKSDAIALASTNTEQLLGIDAEVARMGDLVATEGGDLLDIQSKVVGVISPRKGKVDLF